MSTITKRGLARIVAAQTGCSTDEAVRILTCLFEAMRERLIEGHRIEIRGFGVLTVKDVKARPQGRNPRTGELINVSAHRKTYFRPGRLLKQALSTPLSDFPE